MHNSSNIMGLTAVLVKERKNEWKKRKKEKKVRK